MSETTALFGIVLASAAIISVITWLCIESLKDASDRMADIWGDVPNTGAPSDE